MSDATLLLSFDLLPTASGGVERLRQLILTLAVEGKLVSQEPSDEPATELLEKILEWRRGEERIFRRKVNAKSNEQFDATLSSVPPGWKVVRVSDLLSLRKGRVPKLLNEQGRGLPLLDIEALDRGNVRRYTEDMATPRCSEEDILVVCDGSRSGLVLDGKAGAVGSTLAVIDTPRPVQPYVRLIFRQGYGRWNSAMKGAAIPHLDTKQMLQEEIGLPPLAEQARIVARVEELMKLCDALEEKGRLVDEQHTRLISTLFEALENSESAHALAENWRLVAEHFDLLLDRPEAVDALEQTILQLAVRGLLVPQDPKDEPASELLKRIRAEKDRLIAEGKIKRDKPLTTIAYEERPFDLPAGWEWVRFDELIHPAKPIAYGVLVPGPDIADGIPFVRIADLSLTDPPERPEKAISPEVDVQYQRTRLEGGEILMGVVGSIGKLGVAPPTWAGANIARAICRIVPADRGLHNFVLFLLQTEFMQNGFAGDTRTLAQPTLNVGLIRAALTPIPPPAEQSRIVTRVESLRRYCADLRERLASIQSTQFRLAEALV